MCQKGRVPPNLKTDTEPRQLYLCDVLKALPEMRLHSRGVLSLREDLKKLVVREEVESGEGHPLGFQVIAQSFLDLLQQFVTFSEVLQQTIVSTV